MGAPFPSLFCLKRRRGKVVGGCFKGRRSYFVLEMLFWVVVMKTGGVLLCLWSCDTVFQVNVFMSCYCCVKQIGGKIVNIKFHIRRSQRVVKESRRLCTCECRRPNITMSSSLAWLLRKFIFYAFNFAPSFYLFDVWDVFSIMVKCKNWNLITTTLLLKSMQRNVV